MSGNRERPWYDPPTVRRRAFPFVMALLVATACGGDEGAEPTRSYTLQLHMEDSADEYRYVADEAVDVRVGDEVTFEVRNDGVLPHDLQVQHPSGDAMATAPAVGPGGVLTLTVRFDEPGFYRLNCLVDDHLTRHGMQAVIEVTESGDGGA